MKQDALQLGPEHQWFSLGELHPNPALVWERERGIHALSSKRKLKRGRQGARKCISTILLFFELESWWVGLMAVVPGAKSHTKSQAS